MDEVLEKVEGQPQGQDNTADAARGYARVSGDEPPAEAKPDAPEVSATEAPAETKPAEPAAPEVTVDPNAELRAQLKAELMTELTPTLRNLGGQIGGLNRELKNVLAAAKESAAASASGAPTDKQIAAAVEDPEKWKRLKEEFPEFSEGVAEYVAAHLAATRSQPAQTVDPEALRAQVLQEIAPAIERTRTEARAYARIDLEVGEGWEDTLKSKDFTAWFDKLPGEKKQQYDTDRPADVIACLKEFGTYQSAAQTRQAKRDRLEAAVQVQSTGTGGPQILDDDAAAARGYNRVARR